MKIFLSLLAGFLSGIIGAMGMGGGAVLIIYLTVFLNTARFRAQGINLLFFIPIAAVSVLIYQKRKNIKWKTVLPFCAAGVLGALGGIFLSRFLGVKIISKAFGAGIGLLGIKETAGAVKQIVARNKKRCYNKKE